MILFLILGSWNCRVAIYIDNLKLLLKQLQYFFCFQFCYDKLRVIYLTDKKLCLFDQRFYLIGSDRNKRFFRVLKIDRSEPSDLNISEDPVVYSPQEIKNLLQRIAEGNRATGGLTFVAKVFGIAG